MNLELSIIIPMYNAQKTIIRCIESIENQAANFPFEIIVVDDGSFDESIILLRNMQQKYDNIKIVQQQNLKQSAARNNGLSLAKGKYIMFFDCDDVVEPNMLNKMVDLMVNRDLVVCGIRKVYKNKVIDENKSALANAKSKERLLEFFLTRNKEFDVGLWNKIFKSEIIKENNIKFDNGNFFEDSLFVFKYLYYCNNKKIIYINDCFYNLYKNNGSTTMIYHPEIDHFADVFIKKVSDFLLENNIYLSNSVITAFKLRTRLHVIHHHIKYDDEWVACKQRAFLAFAKGISILKVFNKLNYKYFIAVILAKYFPESYIKIYHRKFD